MYTHDDWSVLSHINNDKFPQDTLQCMTSGMNSIVFNNKHNKQRVKHHYQKLYNFRFYKKTLSHFSLTNFLYTGAKNARKMLQIIWTNSPPYCKLAKKTHCGSSIQRFWNLNIKKVWKKWACNRFRREN